MYSTILDFGRFGALDNGVPICGVMDERAARLANALLGNSEDAAVMEITLVGPKLKFTKSTVIVLTGADLTPLINGKSTMHNSLLSVQSNDILSFGSLRKGVRCYLAVSNGFKTEKVLGSRSMYSGITKTRTITKGDSIKFGNPKVLNINQFSKLKVDETYIDSNELEVFEGPEFEFLSKDEREHLLTKTFSISKDNSRMGYQLNETLQNKLESIITSPVLPGTVQLTPSGKLIVLMKDCQTTGGYPRVLQLSEDAISVLSQKSTGQNIKFCLRALP
ncbi:MAG: biotin-dependent carboxyltransferase family protein [Jejuia sp.]